MKANRFAGCFFLNWKEEGIARRIGNLARVSVSSQEKKAYTICKSHRTILALVKETFIKDNKIIY